MSSPPQPAIGTESARTARTATDTAPSGSATRRLGLCALLVLVSVLAAAYPRGARTLRHEWSTAVGWPAGLPEGVDGRGFFSLDPDGLYHTRRVARAFEHSGAGPRIAPDDPYLNAPHGSAIPWPPYYDQALFLCARPFAPSALAERARFLEMWVASAPFALGLLSAALVALAAWQLGGAPAALVAGLQFALTRGAYNYAQLGVGDHHAWIGLLSLALWLSLSMGLARGALERPRAGAAWGLLAGCVAGLMLGSWVAALVYVVVVDALLGGLLVARSRAEPGPRWDGLPMLGLSFHASALVVLAPAVLASPWKTSDPWISVNLSWFHLTYLALGLLVFAPLVAAPRRFAPGTPGARRHPLACALALAAVTVLGLAAGIGPASGLREAFAWASRENEFMDVVRESRPLFGDGQGAKLFIEALGLLGFLAPLAWLHALRASLRAEPRSRRLALLPWVAAFPVLFVQALGQVRFSNALAGPLAILLGLSAAALVARRMPRAIVWVPAALLLVGAAHYPAWLPKSALRVGYDAPSTFWGPPVQDYVLGERMLHEWLRQRPATGRPVLAHWDDGHAIEWVADRPSVATNFGSYVGQQSYADPPRFFLAGDEAQGLAVLDRRDAQYVVVTRDVWLNMHTMVRAIGAQPADYFADSEGAANGYTERALRTLVAQLVPQVVSRTESSETASTHAFGGLRLVYVSPSFDLRRPDPRSGTPLRAGWIWERVRGAVVEARGRPGDALELALPIDFPGSSFTLAASARALADESGVARLRVPYATTAPNGDGSARGAWRYRFAGRSGELSVPAEAVLGGMTLQLP